MPSPAPKAEQAAKSAPVLIRGAIVVTLDDRDRVLDRADILIEGGRIVSVGPPADEAVAGARVIDGRDRIAFPGMINAHSHSPLSFCKGVYDKVNHRAAMWMFQGM